MSERQSFFRVGLMVAAALGALAAAVLLVGDQNKLFSRKNDYFIQVPGVGGLQEGNPVQLNGVTVGRVAKITLPRDVTDQLLEIRLEVEAKYSDRIRSNSRARIRTFGLLGDKYVDISSGSADAELIAEGGEIPTRPGTDVDKLMAGGEDLLENVVAISHSMRTVLARIDRGEGLVGELVADEESGKKISVAIFQTMESIQGFTTMLEEGKGPIARLINDEKLGNQLASAVRNLSDTMEKVEHGDGILPALLEDPGLKGDLEATLAELRGTAENVRSVTASFEKSSGALPRLLEDEAYADRVLADFERMVANMAAVSEKLNSGDGTAARIVNDPAIYEAVEDIIVGVDESSILSWLIRNRQEKGIEVRYGEAVEAGDIDPIPPSEKH